ncbi:CST complex subunit STN1 [Elsinoe australis]|uniref:CST complex subunit STN1 n=1 Tax=Elsinoe australis TaxID=40998 RepID=A0A2P7YEZ2_9PEZI|nr:CST complex subunit STN1 [Elsinoe australis]
MATNLCCANHHRLDSPDSLAARSAPIRSKKRSQSLPRDQRLSKDDRLELNRIFVAASLPEDHPDAIPLPHRRPALYDRIIRSPSLGRKIKRQLSRTSLVSSKSFISLRPHPTRLLHRRSRTKPKSFTVEDIVEDPSASTNGYDSDAKSVQITALPVNTEERQRVVTPVHQVRPKMSSFEWLAPRRNASGDLSNPSGQYPPSARRRQLARSSSAPCVTEDHFDVHQKSRSAQILTSSSKYSFDEDVFAGAGRNPGAGMSATMPYKLDPATPLDGFNSAQPLRPSATESRLGSSLEGASPKRRRNSASLRESPIHARGVLSRGSSSSSANRPSRFHEDLNSYQQAPAAVKKRRSIFRLPKMIKRKKQSKGKKYQPFKQIETKTVPAFDGPADQKDSLSVPNTDLPRPSVSSAFSRVEPDDLIRDVRTDTGDRTPAARQQSLEEYEKNLTILGDNRRHKSSFNVDNLRNVEEDDRNESVTQVKRPLLRASPLLPSRGKSGEQTLMEKALHMHQQEKCAFFLFKHKDRPSQPAADETDPTAPIFHMSFGPASSPGRILSSLEDIDPLTGSQIRRAQSMMPLSPTATRIPTPMPGRLQSKMSTINSTPLGIPPASWARFSSHDRTARCSPAGDHEGVKARDFVDEPRCYMPDPDHKIHKRKHRLPFLAKPNDSKVAQIWRYYVNIFTSGRASNRRSSIATAGRLKDPELEMLPPVLPVWNEARVPGSWPRGSSDPGSVRASGKSIQKLSDAKAMTATASNAHEAFEMSGSLPPLASSSTERQPSNTSSYVDPRDTSTTSVEDNGPDLSSEMTAKVRNDPALALDGAVDNALLRIAGRTLSPRSSAQWRAADYQRACVRFPALGSSEEAATAALVPLPATPVQTPLRGTRSVRSIGHDKVRNSNATSPVPKKGSLVSPIPDAFAGTKLSSAAKSLLLLPEVEEHVCGVSSSSIGSRNAKDEGDETVTLPEKSETASEFEALKGDRKDSAAPNITVRRFPSVTVVDDRKGQWRSVSLIRTIHSTRGSSNGSMQRSDGGAGSGGRVVSEGGQWDESKGEGKRVGEGEYDGFTAWFEREGEGGAGEVVG